MKRGSSVLAEAVVDGQVVRSNPIVIGNTPPKLLRVMLVPDMSSQIESLLAEASFEDVDEDPVVLIYDWTVNGSPAGKSAKLDRSVKRGDIVRVEVRANDGQANSDPVIMTQDIVNAPPRILDNKNFTFDGVTYTYQAQAIDRDGDAITYSLESPDPAISIQPATGTVVWKVPSDFLGDKDVTIVADDGHGGTARYMVTFTVR